MTLGFINHVSNYPLATMESYKSIRQFYPDAPFFLSIDGTHQHLYRNMLFLNTEYLFNIEQLAYPPYTKEKVLEWLKRMYIGFLKLGTDHVCMIEDDMLVLGPIQYPEDVECFGHNIKIGNDIHGTLLHEIETFSKRPTKATKYGAGGGSIFKSSTFIDNYVKVTQYIDQNWYLFEEYYWPQCGYMDAFMTIYYLLCGKDYTPNPRMINLWPANHTTPPNDIIKTYFGDIDLVHNYKYFYRK